jgi:hypothetical protein
MSTDILYSDLDFVPSLFDHLYDETMNNVEQPVGFKWNSIYFLNIFFYDRNKTFLHAL